MPGNIAIDDTRVSFELTRYLSDNWPPVIEKDVDGPQSLPVQLDRDVPNLGRFSASRRVARTVYLGSAPKAAAANKGLDDRRIKLGSAMPGEAPAIFGDALRRLSTNATYLYQDGNRYWYDTQPTVTKLAEDRAAQLKREPDKVFHEIEKRVREDLRARGDFMRIQPFPASSADVPDELETRLVVFGPDHPHNREGRSSASDEAQKILGTRANAPRLYQNSLVFLAPDHVRLQELEEAVRKYLAWTSIVEEHEVLNLAPDQMRQARGQLQTAETTITARLPETYIWLLVPSQASPQQPIGWQAIRLAGTDPMAVRASKKLRNDELLVSGMAGSTLRMALDRIPLWRGDHVEIRQVAEDHARYVYLQRVTSPDVICAAISGGLSMSSWETDGFAYAESFDASTNRYRGLRAGEPMQITMAAPHGLLVRPATAKPQFLEEEQTRRANSQKDQPAAPPRGGAPVGGSVIPTGDKGTPQTTGIPSATPKRYYGSVQLDATRVARDAGRISEEIIAHLAGLVGSNVRVTLEIHADIPGGVPANVVRTVLENSNTLHFDSKGFEAE